MQQKKREEELTAAMVDKFRDAVRRLHVQLGHSYGGYAEAPPPWWCAHRSVQAARELQCSICQENKRSKVQRFADVPYAPRPLSRVLVDVKEIPVSKNADGSYQMKKMLHVVCDGSS